jgi:hypothetical protein
MQLELGDSVVSGRELGRPNLLWIDAEGTVHSEKWESAEELIQRLTKKKKRKNP